MGKYVFVGAVAVVAIILLVLVAGIFGIVDLGFTVFSDIEMKPEDLLIKGTVSPDEYSNREIHQALCFLFNKTLPYNQHEVFIEGLHMKMYGIDETNAYEILIQYEQNNQEDGFTSYGEAIQRGIGWTAYTEIWYNNINQARGITVADGSAINGAYGHDAVLLTSYGPATDYVDYNNFVRSY